MWTVYLPFIFKFFSVAILAIYGYLKYYHYRYWLRYHIPQVPPTIFVGNLYSLICMKKSSAQTFQYMYNHPNAQNLPIVGIYVFHKPALLLRDPELIKRILIKDFAKFCNRYATSNTLSDPLGSRALFFIKNPAWKDIRNKLTPFFTSTRLNRMFPLVEEVGHNLNKYLVDLITKNSNDKKLCLEIKEICALYTTDVIATIAFGVQANSFKQPNASFRCNGREIFRFTTKRALNYTVVFFLPQLVSYLKTTLVPQAQTAFFRSTIKNIMKEREITGLKRDDLIDILIDFKNQTLRGNGSSDLIFEGDLLVAQATIFFTAGFESTSNTMAFALYELARNPRVQCEVRKEIQTALQTKCERSFWNIIDKLEYMEMVLQETLRMYPPIPFLDRQYNDASQKYSLHPFNSYLIPANMPVFIPVYALHHDPKFYPNPHKFQPERFSPQNRKLLTPYTYLPFGIGPHACIGERLAILQSKVGLFNILRNHRIMTANDNNKIHFNIKLNPKALILQSESGIFLNIMYDPL